MIGGKGSGQDIVNRATPFYSVSACVSSPMYPPVTTVISSGKFRVLFISSISSSSSSELSESSLSSFAATGKWNYIKSQSTIPYPLRTYHPHPPCPCFPCAARWNFFQLASVPVRLRWFGLARKMHPSIIALVLGGIACFLILTYPFRVFRFQVIHFGIIVVRLINGKPKVVRRRRLQRRVERNHCGSIKPLSTVLHWTLLSCVCFAVCRSL